MEVAHTQPTADTSAKASYPKQNPYRNSTSMVDCEFFIYAIEYKGDDVDQNDVSGDKNCRNHGLCDVYE